MTRARVFSLALAITVTSLSLILAVSGTNAQANPKYHVGLIGDFNAPIGEGDRAFAVDAHDSNGVHILVSPDKRRIIRLDLNGKREVFAGNGKPCNPAQKCGDGGPATEARFTAINSIAVAPSGVVFVVDSIGRVRRIKRDKTIDTVARHGRPIPGQPFSNPASVHATTDGHFVLASVDYENDEPPVGRLWKFSADDRPPTLLAGGGTQAIGANETPALLARMESVTIIGEESGSVLFTNTELDGNSFLYELHPDGKIKRLKSLRNIFVNIRAIDAMTVRPPSFSDDSDDIHKVRPRQIIESRLDGSLVAISQDPATSENREDVILSPGRLPTADWINIAPDGSILYLTNGRIYRITEEPPTVRPLRDLAASEVAQQQQLSPVTMRSLPAEIKESITRSPQDSSLRKQHRKSFHPLGATPQEQLSPLHLDHSKTRTVTNHTGEMIAAWYEDNQLFVRRRSAEGVWSKPHRLVDHRPDPAAQPLNSKPVAALNDAGEAVVGFTTLSNGQYSVHISQSLRSGEWLAPATVPLQYQANQPPHPQVVALANGTALISVAQRDGNDKVLLAYIRKHEDVVTHSREGSHTKQIQIWAQPVELTRHQHLSRYHLQVQSDGSPVVAWQEGTLGLSLLEQPPPVPIPPTPNAIRLRIGSPHGAWSPTETVAEPVLEWIPCWQLTTNSHGDIAIAWTRKTPTAGPGDDQPENGADGQPGNENAAEDAENPAEEGPAAEEVLAQPENAAPAAPNEPDPAAIANQWQNALGDPAAELENDTDDIAPDDELPRLDTNAFLDIRIRSNDGEWSPVQTMSDHSYIGGCGLVLTEDGRAVLGSIQHGEHELVFKVGSCTKTLQQPFETLFDGFIWSCLIKNDDGRVTAVFLRVGPAEEQLGNLYAQNHYPDGRWGPAHHIASAVTFPDQTRVAHTATGNTAIRFFQLTPHGLREQIAECQNGVRWRVVPEIERVSIGKQLRYPNSLLLDTLREAAWENNNPAGGVI